MIREQIDKCLDFAEGNKGKFAIRLTKNPGFPGTLLDGTDKQRVIKGYLDQGFSTRQVAEAMHCTQPTIVEHIKQYRKRVEFYNEWCEFWEFSKDIRKIPISIAFKDILNEDEFNKYQKKGVITVGDYLHFSVTMKTTKFCGMLGENEAENNHKSDIFRRIREMCYSIIDMSEKTGF